MEVYFASQETRGFAEKEPLENEESMSGKLTEWRPNRGAHAVLLVDLTADLLGKALRQCERTYAYSFSGRSRWNMLGFREQNMTREGRNPLTDAGTVRRWGQQVRVVSRHCEQPRSP